MAYTNPWDETQPADTALASGIGQYIRNVELNLRERIQTFGAGLLANRPTPEAVWAGVTYFAVDTHQVFVWDGTQWDDITGAVGNPWNGTYYCSASRTIAGTGAGGQVLVQIPLPVVPPGRGFRFKIIVFTAGAGGLHTLGISIGPTKGSSFDISAVSVPNSQLIKISGEICNVTGSQVQQTVAPDPCFNVGASNTINNYVDSFGSVASKNLNVTTNFIFLWIFNPIPTTANTILESFIVELI